MKDKATGKKGGTYRLVKLANLSAELANPKSLLTPGQPFCLLQWQKVG